MDRYLFRQHCIDLLDLKIAQYARSLSDIDIALAEDGKSSAGDKFETSREMLRQEYDKLDTILQNAKRDRLLVEDLDDEAPHQTVKLGSLVKTSIGMMYIAVALGKTSLNEQSVYVISPESPMAMALLDRSIGSKVNVNGREVAVLAIL